MAQTIAYFAQSKVRVKVGYEPPRTMESAFANTTRERSTHAQQQNSWEPPRGGVLPDATLWGPRGAETGKLIYFPEIG